MAGTVVLVAVANLDVTSLQHSLESPPSAVEPVAAQAHDVSGHVVMVSSAPLPDASVKMLHQRTGRPVFQMSAGDQREVRLWQAYSATTDRLLITMDGEIQVSEGHQHPAELGAPDQLSVGDLFAILSRALEVDLHPLLFSNADEGIPVWLPR